MAFRKRSENTYLVAEEDYTLPSSATTEYSSEIDFIKAINRDTQSEYVSFVITVDAVSGTYLDIALYGAYESGGTKFLLKDAVVADITGAGTSAGIVDIKAYPAPYYYIGWTSDADESANTLTLNVIAK